MGSPSSFNSSMFADDWKRSALKDRFEIEKIIYEQASNIKKNLDQNFYRKMLLFINPFGGKGNALKVWKKVENIFGNNKI